MQRANYARTIYYLCLDQTASAPPVLQSAFDLLAIPVPQIEPEQLLQAYQADKHKILLLNYDEHDAIRQRLAPLRLTSPHLETILFQVGKRLCTDDLLSFGNLKGLFYQPSEPEQIARGLAEIINGQNWLPRHVSSQLLHYYRHIFQNHHTKATIELTTRELQILRSLKTGASNMQMAESLFISEFTVKSHLYQIFKKLSVKNRTQAIAWANQNLLS
ncbi:helix-turn-helix transcriptional regulator [Vibrio fluvialis]|jgi:DNA-binding CsgD family transcriptional regulator|uniref:Helix-turn-helix transcriptional regulator n=1 Tax=Vibrio fluvialis TaxID=676 RepID=A0AAX2LQW4_VIBFL|nr:LuxR C-terminal-related transcriptional regulator [Vibrio fluvialis]TNF13133.1 MAG: helix-turn-helix transcriptional regulator [Vibrionaceae bacterium]AMF95455.1 helix-turn-helix transcriptional regulator [Vibrio fluvialis]EKO3369680.1 helix-turn-helix transcriptional regulator [Vibrio fluvialis]EKO3370673.1 helix-turn-helix transcriptional regulator [Vibrio fluvialis]EKO3378856.1 helix-turn-helix transcriptional regulator [Vibrio fluvialis]